MSVTLKSDMKKLHASLKAVKETSRRSFTEIINKALKDVAFRAAQFTPKTKSSVVRAGLRPKLLSRIAAKALTAKQGKFKKSELAAEKKKIMARRLKGIGGVRAGWFPAIVALGGKIRGGEKMKSSGSASKGFAKKAGGLRLSGKISNAVVTTQFAKKTNTGAGNIPFAVSALRQAVLFVANDRAAHAERKRLVSKGLKQHSDK